MTPYLVAGMSYISLSSSFGYPARMMPMSASPILSVKGLRRVEPVIVVAMTTSSATATMN